MPKNIVSKTSPGMNSARRRNASVTSPICRRKHKHLCHSAMRWVDWSRKHGVFLLVKLGGVYYPKSPACRRFIQKTHRPSFHQQFQHWLSWWPWEILSFIWRIQWKVMFHSICWDFFLSFASVVSPNHWDHSWAFVVSVQIHWPLMRQEVFGYTEMSEVQKEVQSNVDVSKNRGNLSPKWMVYNGKPS